MEYLGHGVLSIRGDQSRLQVRVIWVLKLGMPMQGVPESTRLLDSWEGDSPMIGAIKQNVL